MGTFFGRRKPMVISEFQGFKIFTAFVMSLTLKVRFGKIFWQCIGLGT
jgi:hypothetical protein